MIKLNLGCGDQILEGYQNYDLCPINAGVGKLDLNKIPYNFSDDYADEILLSHILEHLDTHPFKIIMECHRILKMGGLLKVLVPMYAPRITHTYYRFPYWYFNPLLTNPIGVVGYVPQTHHIQSQRLFKCEKFRIRRRGIRRITKRYKRGNIPIKHVNIAIKIKYFLNPSNWYTIPPQVYNWFTGAGYWELKKI